ncbi:ABC transporter permease subunit [Paenibacillus filicis]|uniref:ABC transporter permease subunit n=1 Tax=Paenibacillus gyeongsangnamensis TaxID=3388067 RepID=A0ABT4QDS7_9BACL|nr:ABC transporter permease subunit [Paenibacillus filicis]MCZ8515000.1 ABC transporter permease subunit [Paenibacillus filicis]
MNVPLMILFLPVAAYFLIFRYAPMLGLVIAFKDYSFRDGIWGSPWVGWDNFRLILTNAQLLKVIRNTFVLSLLNLFVGFPFPILLAMMLNEIRKAWFKKTMQTLVYLPHFLNWVIVGGILITMFAQQTGTLNHLVEQLTGKPFPFLYNEVSWVIIYLLSGIWKTAGWGAIIYLAALTGISPELYEAASIDGASKWRQAWHITLPGIRSTIMLVFILSMGHIMDVGFDQVYVLQNPAVSGIAEVISTWNYSSGLKGNQFSVAAANGLFESCFGLLFVITANRIARRYEQSIW